MWIRIRDSYGKHICSVHIMQVVTLSGEHQCVIDQYHLDNCFISDVDGGDETTYRLDVENTEISEFSTRALLDELERRCEQ